MTPGAFKIIRTDGTETTVQEKPTIQAIEKAINADYLDTVNLGKGEVMMVDDTGMIDGLPVNGHATRLMRERFPGYPNQIHGDVAIVNDRDFGRGR